ncbi:MAG TPA: hypothetical protein VNS32_22725 [Flavisolibacter sp.]|nr:hypothetical protein [Flavisolibacter sp.]
MLTSVYPSSSRDCAGIQVYRGEKLTSTPRVPSGETMQPLAKTSSVMMATRNPTKLVDANSYFPIQKV